MSLVPDLPDSLPSAGGPLRRAIGRAGLRLLRWRVTNPLPHVSKVVIVVAPHTSNWDFAVAFFAYLAIGFEATWFGKHTLFRWPVGGLLKAFGGVPIERARATTVVDVSIAEFRRRERMVLALAPEGTRKRVPEWKSGFYRIAQGAEVPILPVALDYRTREIRIFVLATATGDYAADVAAIRAHFESAMARYPDQYDA